MMRIFVLALGLCAAAAQAAPIELSYSGRVLDSLGAPIDGETSIQVSLYSQASGGSAFWTQTYTPTLQSGFFTVRLVDDAASDPLDSDDFAADVYVGVTPAGGAELTPRSALATVPLAGRAVHADVADTATSAISATSAVSADGAESLFGRDWGQLKVDYDVNNIQMPPEWTTTFLGQNVDRTWIWSANGPNFRDTSGCGPTLQVYDQESQWEGQYIVTVESSTRLNVQWSGWYLRVNNSAGATIDQGNGNVTATLSLESGQWRVQHMSGVARVTPFECH